MATERRRVYYSGRVQGVGFRFTSQRLARGFAIQGYVRNLDDGRVELVAEGEAVVIEQFLEAIRSEMGDRIHSESSEVEPPGSSTTGGFEIRY